MPRKAEDNAEDAAPPRRSTRIASTPVAKVAETVKTAVKKVTGTKRSTAGGDESKTKKAKVADDEEVDQLADDEEVAKDAIPVIEIGDKLPDLTLKNEKGEDLKIAELANEKGVIMFLVPKADTPGCTKQACGFRDVYKEIEELGYDVYCLSADTSVAQTKWQTKKELPYSLLSDPKRQLVTALGAGKGGKTARSHFIFEKGGKLVDKKMPVKPDESPVLSLKFIKEAKA